MSASIVTAAVCVLIGFLFGITISSIVYHTQLEKLSRRFSETVSNLSKSYNERDRRSHETFRTLDTFHKPKEKITWTAIPGKIDPKLVTSGEVLV